MQFMIFDLFLDYHLLVSWFFFFFFFFQAEDGIRDIGVTGVQTCALPILELAEADGIGRVRFRLLRQALRRVRHARGRDGRGGAAQPATAAAAGRGRRPRSEERRVGKEGRTRWARYDET